ncbi:hypothetical protein KBTX_03959 [wastewater metagenome]|uniref:GGDEF domain-containing protein n=2 Tax=unclassified sequences TaxID=12908 RepID=A0A5B8RFG7_9ZZZZ|nr:MULTISPECIES: sensor domain-containing diguanylate cyclase [Arhodomonas]MCS4503364.1 GGDEF domain-containing protein [Arhodomonas aquaeolei]QEA07600.1 hypothetical protein KBTEX_03959 [uncultured organism]
MAETPIDRLLQLRQPGDASLFQAVWENFPENMFLIRVMEATDDFVIEAINPAEATTLGAWCEGKSLREFLPDATAERVIGNYRECLERAEPIRYEESDVTYFDPSGVQRNGSWLTLLVPLRDGAGRISHLFGISQNITQLRLAHQELERQNQALEARVEERTAELRQAIDRLNTLNSELEHLATRDHLTGAHNRRSLELLVEHELQNARRHNHPLTLLMVDLDDFKTVNDKQGHTAGDERLRQVTTTLRSHLRQVDLLGRYGGDEFIVALPGTDTGDAGHVAERIRNAVERECGVTVSIGVTGSSKADSRLHDLTERADESLLQAKRSGRNQVISLD